MIEFKPFNLRDYKDSVIITDEKIAALYNINGSICKYLFIAPQGEEAKTFYNAEMLCKYLLLQNVPRNAGIAAVGGGSVGDLAGFVCSIYKRGGLRLTHVPTTLLAQIDSSVGGKTAVDVDGIKNAAGTFCKADTAIDVNFLKTLDKEQMLSGKGELFKYRMLSADVDKVYDGQINETIIRACVNYKQSVCDVDPYDGSLRKRLNFGHTIGHALETRYRLPHGIAVANGLYYETEIAYKLGKCGKPYYDYWTKELSSTFDILPRNKVDLSFGAYDKKNDGSNFCFILPNQFDETYVTLSEAKQLLC